MRSRLQGSASPSSERAKVHPSSFCTGFSETAGFGAGSSMTCPTSSRWWRGMHRVAAGHRTHPRRSVCPSTLVLASAYAGWAGSLPAEVVEQRLRQCLREADLPPDQWVPGWIPGLLTESAPAELVAEVVAMMSEFHRAGYRAMAYALAEADLREVLPHIDVPTLLLYGDADQRSPLNVAEDLHAKVPASRLVVLPGVGHLSNVEAAAQFNAEVRIFLRSNQS